jgi:hypothetical protein
MHFANCNEEIVEQIGSLESSINAVLEKAEHPTGVRHNMPSGKKAVKEFMKGVMDAAVESYVESFPESEINMDQRVKHRNTALIGLAAGIVIGVGTYFLHPGG